jgi:trimeric autotransporter adhesin
MQFNNPTSTKKTNMTTLHLKKSISWSPWRFGFSLIPLVLACFALSPTVQAVTPPPDGGYGNQNTAEGTDALHDLTTGVWNTAVGFDALFNNTVGNQNTALGYKALFKNVDGDKSVAFGAQALTNNSTGTQNTATGFNTLFANTTGNNNTGNGYRALNFNNGDDNTATGFNALYNNRTGDMNTATGSQALFGLTDGVQNTAVGAQALANNTASSNTAIGAFALLGNTTGTNNTALGSQAASSNLTGTDINAVGFRALNSNNGVPPQGSFNNAHGNSALVNNTTGRENNAFGDSALSGNITGSFNTAIGDDAGSAITGNWNIDIGKDVIGTKSDAFVTRIGISDPADPSGHVQRACFIGGIVNAPITGVGVVVSAMGQLGVAPVSSARFKDEIKPMNKASEAVFALKPVTFRYKQEIDPARSAQFGLVAEEVAKINPDLVTRDAKGELYTVRYEAVNAMLLNEFLKEHQTVQQQGATISRLEKQIDALTAGLQKVSAQLETSKPATQMVNNP